MPASTRRSAAGLVVKVLLVVLAGGCAGEDTTSTAASRATTTSTTVAPATTTTTTTVPPMTAKERAWLKAIPRVSGEIEKALGVTTFTVTPETMHSYANTLRGCRRGLLRAGAPSDRLQPVYVLVRKGCAQLDKGARCFDSVATFNPIGPGTPEDRAQQRAIQGGFDAGAKGLIPLADAEEEGSRIQAKAG
jgi:hypothetical protein